MPEAEPLPLPRHPEAAQLRARLPPQQTLLDELAAGVPNVDIGRGLVLRAKLAQLLPLGREARLS